MKNRCYFYDAPLFFNFQRKRSSYRETVKMLFFYSNNDAFCLLKRRSSDSF
ncbi:hypothetical protein D922_02868 [Enterococcus faecalis 06-MB-DW-09]|nr:hypothetical protein D922_02868 [Enterococcus faecalis 06-MB-DW-09]